MLIAGLVLSEMSRELFRRFAGNPILQACDWPCPVNVVFNPAAARVGDETVLIARVETLSGVSHLSVARSANGADGWSIDATPLLTPAPGVESEQWGFEDARVVRIDELDSWLITCTAYGPGGPAVYMATTNDFTSVVRRGIIMPPDDKNAAFLPFRIDGNWVLFHRPTAPFVTHQRGGIWLSRSPDMVNWSAPEVVLEPRRGSWWDALRIGIGPPPLWTERGWLLIYHGVKETISGGIYRVGLALLDLDDPAHVLQRSDRWIFGPEAAYERVGDVPNVVFPCGLVHDEASGELRLYYGAADTSIGLATASLEEVLAALPRDRDS